MLEKIISIPPALLVWVPVAGLAVTMAGLILALLSRKLGLGIVSGVALAAIGLTSVDLMPAIRPELLLASFWVVLLTVVGFGVEAFAARLGVRFFRLDRNVMLGASVGLLVTLFTTFGLSMIVAGAFLGAVAGGLFTGSNPKRALIDGVGALLNIFGGDGLRLMCGLSIAAIIVRTVVR